jgi:hypothetical protein
MNTRSLLAIVTASLAQAVVKYGSIPYVYWPASQRGRAGRAG